MVDTKNEFVDYVTVGTHLKVLGLLVTNVGSNRKHVNVNIKITCRGTVRNKKKTSNDC